MDFVFHILYSPSRWRMPWFWILFELNRFSIIEAAGSAAEVAVPWTLFFALNFFPFRRNGVFQSAGVCSAEFPKSMFLCHGVGHVFG